MMRYLAWTGVLVLTLMALGACQRNAPPEAAPVSAATTPAPAPRTPPGPEIPEPAELVSRDGRLDARLEQAPATITVAGQTFVSNVYNGQYVPTVLVVQRGDAVRLTLVNNIAKAEIEIDGPQPSNLHTHGMAISPRQPADNAYVGLPSGAGEATAAAKHHAHVHDYEAPEAFADGSGLVAPNTYVYRWDVPAKHPRGPHWFHPHAHGMVESQVLSGMSGLLIVDGFLQTHYPELSGLRTRRLLLKDIDLPHAKDGAPKTKTINGIAGGVLRMRPGDTQVWEIGHVGADAFFDLAIEGHVLMALGHDANVLEEPQRLEQLFLAPGARAVVAIEAGKPGHYAVRSRAVDTGPAGDPNPEIVLATLVVEGDPVTEPDVSERLTRPAANLGDVHPTVDELKAMPVTRKRTLTFSESADGKTFYIDSKEFSAARDDVTVTLGDVEEWTLLNVTGEKHVFHIHQLDFLVQSINDDDPDAEGLRDVVDLPYAVNGEPGKVVLKIPFIDPLMVGRFPYHCHILEHEDNGMMANLRVLPRPGP